MQLDACGAGHWACVCAVEHGEWKKRVWTVERMGFRRLQKWWGWVGGGGGQTTGRNSDERVEWLVRGDIIFNLINPPDREAIGCSQRKKGFFFFYSVPFQFCHGALSAKCCVQGLAENSAFLRKGRERTCWKCCCVTAKMHIIIWSNIVPRIEMFPFISCARFDHLTAWATESDMTLIKFMQMATLALFNKMAFALRHSVIFLPCLVIFCSVTSTKQVGMADVARMHVYLFIYFTKNKQTCKIWSKTTMVSFVSGFPAINSDSKSFLLVFHVSSFAVLISNNIFTKS